MDLSTLTVPAGATKKRKRVGRGEAYADWRAVFNCNALLTCFEQK